MVADALDNLHDRFPGCETLAFADLSANMVLITNSNTTFRREGLDALCAEAALVFGTSSAPALGDKATVTVFVAAHEHLRIYLRGTKEPSDALCCICSHDIDVDRFVEDAHACLEKIGHGA